MRFSKSLFIVVSVVVVLVTVPSFAAPAPSKTAANQSLESRAADLALVRDIAANEQVAAILASQGFSQQQVDQKLAQLSPQDLHQLAQNVDQLRAAGLTQKEWVYIGIGALAVLLIVVLTK
jgi:predicted exporter